MSIIDWLKEPFILNTICIVLLLLLCSIYNHFQYLKLKKLWNEYQHHHMAARITMRESGIFTKYWIRAFVKGAERWFP